MINQTILFYLNSFAGQSTLLDNVIVFCAQYLGWVLTAILLTWYGLRYRDDRELLERLALVFVPAGFASIVSDVIKHAYFSLRPFASLDEKVLEVLHALFRYGGTESFPSGHTVFFAALGVSLFFYHRKVGTLYMIGALTIGISRVAAGVHWPLDVLSGYILGAACALLAYFLNKKLRFVDIKQS